MSPEAEGFSEAELVELALWKLRGGRLRRNGLITRCVKCGGLTAHVRACWQVRAIAIADGPNDISDRNCWADAEHQDFGQPNERFPLPEGLR